MKSLQFFPMALMFGCPETVQTEQQPTENNEAVYSPMDGGPPAEALMGQTEVTALPEKVQPANQKTSETQQAQMRAGHHTTFSGELRCDGCTGPFVVKVAAFIQPTPTAQVTIPEGGAPQPPTCGVGGHGADVRFPPGRLRLLPRGGRDADGGGGWRSVDDRRALGVLRLRPSMFRDHGFDRYERALRGLIANR